MPALRIGLLLFPRMTQLDLTGPFEVFARLPDAQVLLLWKTLEPIEADSGLRLLPYATLRDCPPLDVVCVPGGPGVNALMEDPEILDWLRRQAEHARYVSSVCTGSLVLGAAGLLRGRRATSHWGARDLLARIRRDAHDRPGSTRRQPVHRRRCHCRDRFRADHGSRTRRPAGRTGNPVADRIRTGAAVRRRNPRGGARRCRPGRTRTRCRHA